MTALQDRAREAARKVAAGLNGAGPHARVVEEQTYDGPTRGDAWEPPDDAVLGPMPKAPSPFAWIEAPEIFAPLPPAPWAVKGLQLGPGRPSMFAAYGSSGKTITAQSLLVAIASDRPVWGEFACKAGLRVAHVDHDQGRRASMRRYQRLAYGLGVPPVLFNGRLRLSSFPEVYLNQASARDVYCREFEGWDVVLLDALRGATPGTDENDSKIRACVDVLTSVSDKIGTAFLLIHHAGKPKDMHADGRTAPRGSSAIFDACGSVFAITRTGNDRCEPVQVSHEKPSADAEGSGVDAFQLRIVDVPDETSPVAGVRVEYIRNGPRKSETPTELLSRITYEVFNVIRKAGPKGASGNMIEHAVPGKALTIRAAIDQLLCSGQIRDNGPGHRHCYVAVTSSVSDDGELGN